MFSRTFVAQTPESLLSLEDLDSASLPTNFQENSHFNLGDKVLMPSSALEELQGQADVEYPLTFELRDGGWKRTFVGVLEFSAPEGMVILPTKVISCLDVVAGASVSIRYSKLPKATYAQFQVRIASAG